MATVSEEDPVGGGRRRIRVGRGGVFVERRGGATLRWRRSGRIEQAGRCKRKIPAAGAGDANAECRTGRRRRRDERKMHGVVKSCCAKHSLPVVEVYRSFALVCAFGCFVGLLDGAAPIGRFRHHGPGQSTGTVSHLGRSLCFFFPCPSCTIPPHQRPKSALITRLERERGFLFFSLAFFP